MSRIPNGSKRQELVGVDYALCCGGSTADGFALGFGAGEMISRRRREAARLRRIND